MRLPISPPALKQKGPGADSTCCHPAQRCSYSARRYFAMHRPAPLNAAAAPALTHYENFPVASWLCPPALRPAIAAIYHFARTADDLADEGPADPDTRLRELAAYRSDLLACAQGPASSARWPQVFTPLADILSSHALPLHLMTDLLDAFEQDVRMTAVQARYASDADLLDYCTRSANPVGRLLLHLYRIDDPLSLQQSDQICTALQLINFWQDLSVDIARQRWYPSQAAMARFGVSEADLHCTSQSPQARQLVQAYAVQARTLMLQGAPLATRMAGRAGWELRLVVQGGLRILDKIERLHYATWQTRPRLHASDAPLMLWRALRMGAPA